MVVYDVDEEEPLQQHQPKTALGHLKCHHTLQLLKGFNLSNESRKQIDLAQMMQIYRGC